MDGAQARISPKEAGTVGVRLFEEIMSEHHPERVLLEGLASDERKGQWLVTVGFDTVRRSVAPKTLKVTRPNLNALGTLLESLSPGEYKREVVREFRTLTLKASDGSFVKLAHG